MHCNLGRAYEYLLRKFAEGSGQSADEFFTPTEAGFLMAYILRPRPGETCHDYACGSAGLLMSAYVPGWQAMERQSGYFARGISAPS
ncbi:MAG: SAM-dependent methyltransferase [Azoarcus sp.]|jgi:type I restriction-modification system DNA methylase subunit|nr:SAM-dependent methyltransferase [Azoarcus sp.]